MIIVYIICGAALLLGCLAYAVCVVSGRCSAAEREGPPEPTTDTAVGEAVAENAAAAPSPLVTVLEAAQIVAFSETGIRNAIRRGALSVVPGIRPALLPREAVEDFRDKVATRPRPLGRPRKYAA